MPCPYGVVLYMKKILLYYHTLKYLKFKQIRYRAYYMLRARWRKLTKFKYNFNSDKKFTVNSLTLLPSIPNHTSFLSNNSFSFLNLEKTFDGKNRRDRSRPVPTVFTKIDWNFNEYGKLWTYNLTYFEYLNQQEISSEIGVQLIHDFIRKTDSIKDGLEPFPISLRIINWIKFLTNNNTQDAEIDKHLYIQSEILVDSLEYHLLGNHLLENGFALLFAAYYFSDEKFYNKAIAILQPELEEQILADGAHFELSPMYHCLMLYRVLDCINLLGRNTLHFQNARYLSEILQEKAALMLGWLHQMTFQNGDFPRLNDSTPDIAPTPHELFNYASRLNIEIEDIDLEESGYLKFYSTDYECIVDVGHIGPDYIPGHAHSDTFNFVVHAKGQPFIVDTGISTYENDENRHYERSTSAHNTVQIGDLEQSEVWSSFRVARRAKVTHLNETKSTIKATHNGYTRIGATHDREFVFSEKKIFIKDIISTKKNTQKRAFIHFHPNVKAILKDSVIETNLGKIQIVGSKNIKLASYMYAKGYNDRVEAQKIIITFEDDYLETQILL